MDLPELLAYCAALEKNNERTWFHANHDWYDRARASFLELLEQLRFTVAGAAPALADEILQVPARDWTYRIPRDMRMHKNRPPYEPSFRAYLSRDKKSWLPIGYFIRLKPGGSCFGTGLWCEDTAGMNRVRDYIQENYPELEALAADSGLCLSGERLKRAPRGYDETHPAIGWLKYKNWSVLEELPDETAADCTRLCEWVEARVRAMEPLRLFFLRAATQSTTQKKLLEDFYQFGACE